MMKIAMSLLSWSLSILLPEAQPRTWPKLSVCISQTSHSFTVKQVDLIEINGPLLTRDFYLLPNAIWERQPCTEMTWGRNSRQVPWRVCAFTRSLAEIKPWSYQIIFGYDYGMVKFLQMDRFIYNMKLVAEVLWECVRVGYHVGLPCNMSADALRSCLDRPVRSCSWIWAVHQQPTFCQTQVKYYNFPAMYCKTVSSTMAQHPA